MKTIAFMTSKNRPNWSASSTISLLLQTKKPDAIFAIFENGEDARILADLQGLFSIENVDLHVMEVDSRGVCACKNEAMKAIMKHHPDFDVLLMYDDGIVFKSDYIKDLTSLIESDYGHHIGCISGTVQTFDSGSFSHIEPTTVISSLDQLASGQNAVNGTGLIQEFKHHRNHGGLSMPQIHKWKTTESLGFFEADYLVSSFMMTRPGVRAAKISEGKWFDESLDIEGKITIGDEVDISRRIKAAGLSLNIVPSSEAFHISIGHGGIFDKEISKEEFQIQFDKTEL